MARLLDGGAEQECPLCAVLSCRQPRPALYDERTELYFCDRECFTEYLTEEPEAFAGWYAGISLNDIS